MPDADVVRLVDEILAALADAGEVENWAAAYLKGPQSPAVLDAACVEVTERLLGAEPPARRSGSTWCSPWRSSRRNRTGSMT